MNNKEASRKEKEVLDFILSAQNADGSFTTYESYPVVNPDAGWTMLPDPSPFITANILYSLMQLDDSRAAAAIQRGVANLNALKIGEGYWRFWPSKSKQHPIPLDMDDTCLVSFILQMNGITLNNKQVLLSNKNKQGYFETWLTPRWKTFFISPVSALGFMYDCYHSLPTKNVAYLTFSDKEPAVAANALLYLGQQKNEACIDLVIQEIENENMRLQYYADEVMVYYHIARAYRNGVEKFACLAPLITSRLKNKLQETSVTSSLLLALMAANILIDFNTDIPFAHQIIDLVAASEYAPNHWPCLAYFSSEDRNFLAGSPQFTAALYLEACAKLK